MPPRAALLRAAWLYPHGDAADTVGRSVTGRFADDAEAGTPEKRLGAEVGIVVFGARRTRARIRLYRGCALAFRVRDGRADQRKRDAAAARRRTHGNARDNPDLHIVDARRCARCIHATQLLPRCDGDPADRLVAFEREQPGSAAATREPRHRLATAAASEPLSGRGVQARKHAPAARTPAAAQNFSHAMHETRRQTADVERSKQTH